MIDSMHVLFHPLEVAVVCMRSSIGSELNVNARSTLNKLEKNNGIKMHIHNLNTWQHSHQFNADKAHGERNTKRVIFLTLFMMVIEISAGYLFGSMALLADGWHMGTHAVALGITVSAYYYARLHSNNPAYSFGTGKVGVLGGFASAVVLAVIALFMGFESLTRLINPLPIHFNEAIVVAA
jgi:Co/Zn/Cd efflux system component